MSNNVLYIVFPVRSHYTAFFCLPLDQNADNRVYVTGNSLYKDIITKSGFKFINFNYYSRVEINSFSTSFWYFLGLLLNPFRRLRRYKNLLITAYQIKALVKKLDPGVIYLDAHLSYYTLFIPKIYKVLIINTKLRSDRQKGIPPLYSTFMPNGSKLSNIICEVLWYNHIVKYTFSQVIKKITYLKTDEVSLFKVYAKKHGIDFKALFLHECNCSFYLEINPILTGIETIIISPSNFDYPWSSCNFIIQKDPIPHTIDEVVDINLLKFIENFRNNKLLNKDLKLIYCSAGINNKLYAEKVFLFLNKIISVCDLNKTYYYIVSTGGIKSQIKTQCIQSNILFLDYVPQLYVLSICDLFITHGGLNSIRECIHFKKPMLVYPIDIRFDQPGNAARVVYNKIGLRGSIKKDSPFDIIKKINYCLNIYYKSSS